MLATFWSVLYWVGWLIVAGSFGSAVFHSVLAVRDAVRPTELVHHRTFYSCGTCGGFVATGPERSGVTVIRGAAWRDCVCDR